MLEHLLNFNCVLIYPYLIEHLKEKDLGMLKWDPFLSTLHIGLDTTDSKKPKGTL